MYRYEAIVGTTIPDVQDNYTIGLFEKALANPNATRTVAFNPFAPVQDLVNTSSPLYQNWHLQINISDFSVPNAQNVVQNETDFTWSETTLVDPHVIDYSYGFSWPSTGDSPLESALPGNVTDVCFATLAPWATPANALEAGLQVMAVAPVVGNVSRAQVLCTRIDAARVGDDDDEDSGGDVSAGWLVRADSRVAALVVLGWTLAAAYAA
ncbi:hypothetical protein LQW54_011984 [Pestalotiopsis sp. IQ-011]